MAHAEVAEVEAGAARSEGNVMLAAGLALVVAALGFGLGGGHASHGHGHATVTAPTAHGAQAGVATASPEASQVALKVLEDGGNAFDALVAASFAVSVTRPQSTGIGGGGFVVWHRANTDAQGAYDGREVAPISASRDMYLDANGDVTRGSLDGPTAGGVPGLVRMLHSVYQDLGKLSPDGSKALTWKRLVQPAIDLARHGFTVRDQLSEAIEGRRKVLARYPSSAQVFLPGGQVPQPGDVLVQTDLANTLIQIAEDPESFYKGDLAERIASGVPGFQVADLFGYQVRTPEPVRGEYRGHAVISMPPPSSGGVHLVQMLNMFSAHPQPLGDTEWQGADHIHLMTEAMRRAYADRSEHLGDPYPGVGSKVPVAGLTSTAYAEELYQGIDVRAANESDHTTHISIVDAEGNAAASTQTINTHLGSGYVIPGTGILLNNEMDDFAAKPGTSNYFGLKQGEKNAVRPGRRPLSSMTPTIVLDEAGDVRLVVGSPGGSKIITATLQVLVNVVDFGMPLDEAVAAPRIHHQWLYKGRDELFADEGLPKATLGELARRGHVVRVGAMKLGNVQAVEVGDDGTRTAVSDPRGTGRPSAN
jgi:gamma-glutamyltranspeptidase/glutathione hydrolase